MSDYWTWSQIKTKIESDLDLAEETFIEPDEMLGYVNEGIRVAEAQIHSMYEDYFLKRSTITMAVGQESYDLPDDIYAHKIRRLVYQNGSTVFEIKRLRDWKKFEILADGEMQSNNTVLGYMLINDTPGQPKMLLSPIPNESGPYLKLWYLREANKLVNLTDICDIPEFVNFVIKYAKVKCMEKETNPNLSVGLADLEKERENMVSTLANMVPDANNQIEADFSHYYEHS